MLVDADPNEALAILRAMRVVATAGGTAALSDHDRVALTAAHHYVFRGQDLLDVTALAPIEPSALAAAVTSAHLRHHAVSFLAVMATVDGTIDPAKIDLVHAYAAALGTDNDEVRQLSEAAAGHLQWVISDMTRRNMLSITGRDLGGDEQRWILPYGDAPDPGLVTRYESLSELDDGTFGRAFHDFYRINGFRFAGDPAALSAQFATPHDSTHVLSGYSTTPQGELLVSTFTAGMHPHEPVSGHILPVIFSWHLGVKIIDAAGRFTGALDPEKFWVAWSRGSALVTDVFDPAWDFWAAARVPLAELRARYEVPPLDPAEEADHTAPAWYHPSA